MPRISTNPTNSRVKSDESPEPLGPGRDVYTYLEDTIRSLFDSSQSCSPWKLYGKPDRPSYNAERESKSLPRISLADPSLIIPVALSAANSTRAPEIYYLMVEYFSDTSSLHREYTMRTSDGFRGIFYQDSPHVQSIIDELNLQFSTLVKKCSAGYLNHDHRLYTKEYVDKVYFPSLLPREEEGGVHSFGVTLLGYIEAARDGMYEPLVKYCIAFAFPRIQICYLIQMATIKRAKTHMQISAYYKGYIALIQSNGLILEDVKRFIYSLMRWKMYPILDWRSFNDGSYPPKTCLQVSSNSDTSSDTENQSGPQSAR